MEHPVASAQDRIDQIANLEDLPIRRRLGAGRLGHRLPHRVLSKGPAISP